MTSISFFVAGKPQPAGSKRAFVLKGGKHKGRAIITDANPRSKDWQGDVRGEAQRAYQGEPLSGPLQMDVTFTLLRPKGHFRTGKNADVLRDGAPEYPTGRPDATKLVRGIEDALTAIIYVDDAQIVDQHAFKRYGTREGALIEIAQLDSRTPHVGAFDNSVKQPEMI